MILAKILVDFNKTSFCLLRGKGLELRSALLLRSVAEAKELPSPLTIPQPLRRERWRHGFAGAKRRRFCNF